MKKFSNVVCTSLFFLMLMASISLGGKPDLTVTNVYLVEHAYGNKCRIMVTVKNIGQGAIPDSQFNEATVFLLEGNGFVRGGYALTAVDRSGVLKRPGSTHTFPWNAILLDPGTYKFGAEIDATHVIDESNENNNRFDPITLVCRGGTASNQSNLPDLIVSDIKLVQDCKIQVTVANVGNADLPLSAYDLTQGVGIQMYRNNKPWGGISLGAVDPYKRLIHKGGSVSFIWFPQASNLKLPYGRSEIKVVVDSGNSVRESNEGNNTKIKVLNCEVTNLGLYGYPKIGKNKKLVYWNSTVVLKPSDAVNISHGKPAFDIYYSYRNYGTKPASGFKNKLYFNGKVVSIQSNQSARGGEIVNVATQAYMGPQNGKLCFKIDADDVVAEPNENNNYACINVKFEGFSSSNILRPSSFPKIRKNVTHPSVPVQDIPRKKPNTLLPGEKVK